MLKQSAVYLPSRAIPGALNFLGLVIYARMLGPAAFGHLTLIVGAASVVNAAVLYWVRSSYLRVTAGSADDRAERSVVLALNAALLAAVVLLASVGALLGWVPWWEACSVVALVGAQNACEVRQEFLRAHERVTAYGAVALIRALVALPVGWALLRFSGLGVTGPVLGLIAGGLAGLLYAQAVDRQSLRGHFSLTVLPSLTRYGLPLIPYFAVQALLGNVDRFLLSRLLGLHAAGSYGAGYDAVQQTIGLIFVAVSLAGLPLIYKAHALGGILWRARAREYGRLLLVAVVFVAAGLTCYHAEVTRLLLGEAYSAASVTLPIIAWAAVLAGLRSSYSDVAFQLSRQTAWQLPGALVALVTNVTLDVLLIPRLGIPGAALGSLGAQCLALVLSVVLALRIGPVPWPGRALLQAGGAGAVMLLVSRVTAPWPFALSATAACLGYALWVSAFHVPALTARLRRRRPAAVQAPAVSPPPGEPAQEPPR